ncbi:MAG: hypothetical protein PHY12_00610, partial [Eubacteriales bacterium]|nr:hypothetical protein [Eubacteriales bacterium]
RKENSADYRYFPDPDLPETVLTREEIEALRASLPTLPDARRESYMSRYGLSAYAAEQLTSERWLADYFEEAAQAAQSPVAVANLLQGEAFALMGARAAAAEKAGLPAIEGRPALPIAPAHFAALSDLLAAGRVNSSTGKKILAALFEEDQNPQDYAQAHDLFALTDEGALSDAVSRTLAQNPDLVESYRKGKLSVEKALMGKAMGLTHGKADPEKLQTLLHDALLRTV